MKYIKKNKIFLLILVSIILMIISVWGDDYLHNNSSNRIVRIYGNITNTEGNKIAYAIVMFIIDADTTYTQSDIRGSYSIELTSYQDSIGIPYDSNLDNPKEFILKQNYPNPFNSYTIIEYQIPQKSNIRLEIYNTTGQLIKRLRDSIENPGTFKVKWDGRDNKGRYVGSGVYIYRLQTDTFIQSKKMLLIDGGNYCLSFDGNSFLSRLAPKSAKIAESVYDIIVEKYKYETYREYGFVLPKGISELEKNFILRKLIPPTADAGPDHTIKVGNYITLDGSGSTYGDGDTLIYNWEEEENNPVNNIIQLYVISTSTKEKVRVGFNKEGTYKFKLIVNNGILNSYPDEVVVTVNKQDEVIFEDPNLELAIRLALDKPVEELVENDFLSIKSLRWYSTQSNYKISSLHNIDKCFNLTSLNLALQQISDVSPLEHLTKLNELDLQQNHVLEDITPLSKLTELRILNIETNRIKDISPLSGLIKLNYLNLLYNPISDISAMENMAEMDDLWLGSSPINDISALSGMKKLTELWIQNCGVTDINSLMGMIDLIRLNLGDNNITDISSLKNMTKLKFLMLEGNQIEDISSLEYLVNLKMVRLWSNRIKDIEPLVKNNGLGQGVLIGLTHNPLNETSINVYIPALQTRGVHVDW